MTKYSSQAHIMPLELFRSDLSNLPKTNRWVRLGDSLPWDKIELIYNARLHNGNRGAGNFKATHAVYSGIVKKKNKPKKELKRCTEYLLNALFRGIHTAFGLIARNSMDCFTGLKRNDRKLFFTIMKMWWQQKVMFQTGIHRCEDRIVSIFQPHVRPIVRGKARSRVEFGSKIGVSVVEGYSFTDHFS